VITRVPLGKTDKILMAFVQLNRILVPLDGSKNSIRALDFAIELARNSRGIITGIFVLERTPDVDFRRIGSIEKYMLKEAKEFLEAGKIRSAKKAIVFKDKIAFGDPGYTIVNFAKKNKYRIIVMGSRGRGHVKEALLGSVSNYVVHKSTLPVLLVK
jgi:nucleotide-binding universal stress UspA family protein